MSYQLHASAPLPTAKTSGIYWICFISGNFSLIFERFLVRIWAGISAIVGEILLGFPQSLQASVK
jgi:hypothetical protein